MQKLAIALAVLLFAGSLEATQTEKKSWEETEATFINDICNTLSGGFVFSSSLPEVAASVEEKMVKIRVLITLKTDLKVMQYVFGQLKKFEAESCKKTGLAKGSIRIIDCGIFGDKLLSIPQSTIWRLSTYLFNLDITLDFVSNNGEVVYKKIIPFRHLGFMRWDRGEFRFGPDTIDRETSKHFEFWINPEQLRKFQSVKVTLQNPQ